MREEKLEKIKEYYKKLNINSGILLEIICVLISLFITAKVVSNEETSIGIKIYNIILSLICCLCLYVVYKNNKSNNNNNNLNLK